MIVCFPFYFFIASINFRTIEEILLHRIVNEQIESLKKG